MIVYGWGKKILNLGSVGTVSCPMCEKDRNLILTIIYSYFTLFWILMAGGNRKDYYFCEICGRGVEVDKKEVDSALRHDPLPWLPPYGWTIPVGGIVVLIFLGLISG